ncbi:hypothetical protein ES703_89898 [subsurface metagenome]
MTEHGKGVRVTDCPIGQEVCYPSCYWQKGGKCYGRSKRGRRIVKIVAERRSR